MTSESVLWYMYAFLDSPAKCLGQYVLVVNSVFVAKKFPVHRVNSNKQLILSGLILANHTNNNNVMCQTMLTVVISDIKGPSLNQI